MTAHGVWRTLMVLMGLYFLTAAYGGAGWFAGLAGCVAVLMGVMGDE